MLKITTQVEAGHRSLELEGRLAGPWVDELASCWRRLAGPTGLRVKLKAVTYIDEAGKRLLTEMHRQGVAIEGSGCMTGSIIEGILREGKS